MPTEMENLHSFRILNLAAHQKITLKSANLENDKLLYISLLTSCEFFKLQTGIPSSKQMKIGLYLCSQSLLSSFSFFFSF